MSKWHLDGDLKFSVGQQSIAGAKPQNEDSIGIRIPTGVLLNTKGAVAVIADGVSAAEAGKEASETCVYNFLTDYYSTPDSWSVRKSASQVLTALNRWLCAKGSHFISQQKGYVSTFSCIVFKSRTAHLFHVGDTRIYRFRDGSLEQLTRDHATPISDQQTYLTRAMGLDVGLDVDYQAVTLELGDIFLLSSDGVHDFISRQLIRELIAECNEDFEGCCEVLIEKALANNSQDNLSCQILRVDSLPQQDVNDVYQKLTALPFPPTLEKGMILDGFRIEKEIHASSRSQLYIVESIETGNRYCLKTPSVNFEDDPAYIERFILESWIGARIQSPHVIKVIKTTKQPSFLYYLTDYIDGMTLRQWIIENPKPAVQNVIYIIEQVIKGIRAFHRQETLHQDIKPENILIDQNGEVKIIDFGSCLVKGIDEIATPLERDLILGTASYSAPEAVLKRDVTTQADIFSVAVIAYEMFSGETPFQGKLEDCRTEKAYLKTTYIPSYELNPLVPVWIDGALKKALRFEPERRYGDVSEFMHELQTPNPKYKKYHEAPFAVKRPLLFWQLLSAALFIALCISLGANA